MPMVGCIPIARSLANTPKALTPGLTTMPGLHRLSGRIFLYHNIPLEAPPNPTSSLPLLQAQSVAGSTSILHSTPPIQVVSSLRICKMSQTHCISLLSLLDNAMESLATQLEAQLQ